VNTAVMFASTTDEWETPQATFDALAAEFEFHLDLCASATNFKLRPYYTAEMDALSIDWSADNFASPGPPTGFCNPPYSRGLQGKFIAKAAEERRRGFQTVMLLPARTDTKAFHAHIYDASKWQAREGVEIRLLPGRLKFGGAANSAPFPSMIVVFRP
jgi:phage N-6-adenine-methyltransferase